MAQSVSPSFPAVLDLVDALPSGIKASFGLRGDSPTRRTAGGQIQSSKRGRPCKQFTVEVVLNPVPLPEEKAAAYYAAWREIGRMIQGNE